MTRPTRLLFVCLGNICRSLAGENVMRHASCVMRCAHTSARLVLFCEFCDQHGGTEVPDPYYGGPEGFEKVLDLLEDGCSAFLRRWSAGDLD